jgi:RNA polymerase sigma-70 factor (ECF subfamily)
MAKRSRQDNDRVDAMIASVRPISSESLKTPEIVRAQDDIAAAIVRMPQRSAPEGDREILMLTAWEGLTPREIAAVMGISANVVRVRLHRARRRVEQRLRGNSTTSAAPGCTSASA